MTISIFVSVLIVLAFTLIIVVGSRPVEKRIRK